MLRIFNCQGAKRSRLLHAGAGAGISIVTLAAGLTWAAVPAHAGTAFYELAFQASTGNLTTAGVKNCCAWNQPIMPGTSPAIAFNPGNTTIVPNAPAGYEEAYQDTSGQLVLFGPAAVTDTGLSMESGTSPGISCFGEGGCVVAYQATNGDVMTFGGFADGVKDWGPAAPGTSPSVTALFTASPVDSFEVAFQGPFGNMVTEGADPHGPWDLGMMPGTNPSITGLSNGSYEVAFQANTGSLWTVGSDNHGDWKLDMMAGTDPSITAQPNGRYEVAFQANTGSLWTVGSDNHGDWKLGMMAGTHPSITTGPTGSGYEVAFQANTGQVWTIGLDNHNAWNANNGTALNTSPSIAGA